jgi:hypothetical protein
MTYYPGDTNWSVTGPNSPLNGTGELADDLYFIAHHEVTGKPYLQPRTLGTGLAGGLLAELMTSGMPALTLDHGCLVPVQLAGGELSARYAGPEEPEQRHVLELVIAEPTPRPARDWLLFLGQTAAAEVAGRLERYGYLVRPPSRIPGRSRRPVPPDPDWAHCALLRAHAAIDATRTPAPYAALLAGLAFACGLGFRLVNLSGMPTRSIGEAITVLPPTTRELISHVQRTADTSLLSQRK